ncbi:MAG: sce7725 family protein, partial [Tissierellales bacterium]|nr:sce7725 family protein [Tissierellales bacterium]
GLSDIKFHVFLEKATSKDYRDLFNNFDCILIRDGFRRRTRNADYPASEYFSDLHKTYQSEGYYGFGDFSIVGDNFSSGGPAYAVAIHLTYLKENGDIWINHFISDRTERPVDPGGKFLEALRKLVAFLDKYPIIIKNSQACQEFKGLFSAQRYPGLGYVKKLSMKHHIELMNFLLS